MKFQKVALIALLFTSLANTNVIRSQTYKVKTGTLNGSPVFTEVYEYDYVEEKPEFPGGVGSLINFINSTRQYPTEAYETGIEGRVTCAFVVHSDGKISHINVLRGVEPSLNHEAVRIISQMPEWHPGKINNEPVPVRVICYIPFRK